jgi:hypothetical protein
VSVVTEYDAAAARTRWEEWQSRGQRVSRRSARRARIVASVIFAAIVANLLVQLFARR